MRLTGWCALPTLAAPSLQPALRQLALLFYQAAQPSPPRLRLLTAPPPSGTLTGQSMRAQHPFPSGFVGSLPPLSIGEVRAAALSFPAITAVGLDWIGPRSLAILSDAGTEALIALYHSIECTGTLPAQLGRLAIVFIPKPDGGHRPIGLLDGVLRVLDLCRRPLVRAWANTHERMFFLGGAGKCSIKANWTQLSMDEVARARGL